MPQAVQDRRRKRPSYMRNHRERARDRRIVQALIGVGVVLLLVAGGLYLGTRDDDGGSSEADVPGGGAETPSISTIEDAPADGELDADQQAEGFEDLFAGAGGGTISDPNDPFSQPGSSDPNEVHSVTVSASANDAIYVGYRFRDGKGSGLKVATRSFSLTRSVKGSLPVAQVGAQAIGSSTSVTCTITVDGVVTARYTAKGGGGVAVCTG